MSRSRPSAWVLNLDAEYELENCTAHTPRARTLARMPELVQALAPLFGPEDVVLGEDDRVAPDYAGRAWCPTPSAKRRLEKAGAVPVPAPELLVLRKVNHRRFSAGLGQTLPGAQYVERIEELLATIAGKSPTGHWLLKRAFGFAGRGRRKVARGVLDPSARTWVVASLRTGDGMQIEPWAFRTADFAQHGYVTRAGAIVLGQPTQQECDDAGAWKQTVTATDLDAAERTALAGEAMLAGQALARAAYFGPFGVDAFRWRDGEVLRFNPRSEINARYSMGWAIGMQGHRVDLDET